MAQLEFLKHWINDHIEDTQQVLHKPVLFAEFGKSWKDPNYNVSQKDDLYNMVYSSIYTSASRSGAAAGCLFWQQLVHGMESYNDGYEVILTEPSSTTRLIVQQSKKLSLAHRRFVTKKNRQAHKTKKSNDTDKKN